MQRCPRWGSKRLPSAWRDRTLCWPNIPLCRPASASVASAGRSSVCAYIGGFACCQVSQASVWGGVWMTCMQVCTWVHKISSWVSLHPFITYTTLSSARSRRAKTNVSIDVVRGKVHSRQVASLLKGLKIHSMICSCNKRLKWLKGVASSDEQSSSQLLVHSHCSHHGSFQQQLFLANKL